MMSKISFRRVWNLISIPQNAFLILALFFGVVFITVTPPFQSPDEPEHFFRAYEISEGHFLGQQEDNRLGGYLPQSMVELRNYFLSLRWNPERKTNDAEIMRLMNMPLCAEHKLFADFPNTAIYPPFAYFPQALTISILRWFQMPPLLIFYMARLSSLICWMIMVFQAIKIMPGFKWYLTLLALLPMSVFINASVSADVVTNGISFLLIAFIFKCAFTDEQVAAWDWVLTILLVIFLGSAKVIYSSLALLVVIIPAKRFRNSYFKYIFVLIVLTSAFLTMLFWSTIINKLYIPYADYNSLYRENIELTMKFNMNQQLTLIKADLFYLTKAIVYATATIPGVFMHSYIGIFGWLEIPLPVWTVVLAFAAILIVLIFDQPFAVNRLIEERLIYFMVSATLISLILFSQLLIWTPPGDLLIGGIQGRYFIPVAPLLFLVIRPNIFRPTKLIAPLVMLLSVFLLSISTILIYEKYY